jgi:hypothetical protein
MGPSLAVSQQREKYLGMAMPSLSKSLLEPIPANKTAQEHNIPVYFYNSANGTLDKRIAQTSFDGGAINVNLLSLEAETASAVIAAKTWKQRFDKAYKENPHFKFEQDPRFLDQFLLLGFHGDNPNADAARDRILDSNLEEQLAVAVSRIYLENLFRQSLHQEGTEKLGEDDLTFWAGIAQGRRDNVSALFKDNSNTTIKEAYEKIELALGIGEMNEDSLDASNIKRGLGQILNIEARLRAMAKSNNPIYLLLKSMQHVIIPMRQELKESQKESKAFRYGAEVILTKLLTEKLLGKTGEELCKSVNWDELLKMDFTTFNAYSYQNFLQDQSNPKNDPYGLMKLRQAWYRFFDEKLSGADYKERFNTLAKSSLIQNAARSLVKREFTSYQDRKTPQHLDYYRKHRSFGALDKINDMAA